VETKLPGWTEGVQNTLKRNNATMTDPYSWHAIDSDGLVIFITEADHINKNSSIVKLKDKYIQRNIDPSGKDWGATTIRHATEVFFAVRHAFTSDVPVRALLTRNSRYSETPNKPIKAMLLPWKYKVTELIGDSIETGFSYRLEQI